VKPYGFCNIMWFLCSGAPLLGAAETVKALMIGVTFGLPISEVCSFLPDCIVIVIVIVIVILIVGQ
jgi:hypothetical protein